MDVIEIDAATNRGIEEVRGLIATATAEPARDRYRIFILDEAHQVTDAAFNALLKTLEEPPSWVVFMMATTQPEDIPQTIRSRCQHFSFHAVRFDEIVGQLRDIAQAEKIEIEEDALALLAEAGDGSMRDALSIMDQAIACSTGALAAEVVRGLVGSVSTEVLERLMQAVHSNSSEEVLRIVDKLMVEGQSATHFARQTVRFLRNALVAKVAGVESSALQISADEKKRVGGIAELFTEEELTRFLNIMLRTFGDVSYKQEQRFHLELGLLKLVHAQRLLPIEQLLSSVRLTEAPAAPAASASAPRSSQTAPAARPASASHPTSTPQPSAPPSFTQRPPGVPPMGGGSAPRPSPFEADRARKGREELSSPDAPESITNDAPASISNGAPRGLAAQPAPQAFAGRNIAPVFAPPIAPQAVSAPASAAFDNGSALAVVPQREHFNAPQREASAAQRGSADSALDLDSIRNAVLEAMQSAGSQILVHAMEEGSWTAEASLITVQVEMSASMIELSYTREQERAANQTAGRAAGRAVKLRLVPGAAPADGKPRAASRSTASSAGIKSKAADEPLVKRMMEKFGAEIRIVMDRSQR
jgi:DNA polymerase-3 subunit gamma/tau